MAPSQVSSARRNHVLTEGGLGDSAAATGPTASSGSATGTRVPLPAATRVGRGQGACSWDGDDLLGQGCILAPTDVALNVLELCRRSDKRQRPIFRQCWRHSTRCSARRNATGASSSSKFEGARLRLAARGDSASVRNFLEMHEVPALVHRIVADGARDLPCRSRLKEAGWQGQVRC